MKKSWAFSNQEALKTEIRNEDKPDTSSTGNIPNALKRFFKKERSESISDTHRASTSSRHDQSDYCLGKTVKIKGGHLKNNNTFAGLILTQELCLEVPERPTLRRSDSVSSFSSVQDIPTQQGIWVMRFSYCGGYLAAGRNDGTVVVWKRFLPSDIESSEKAQSTPNLVNLKLPNIKVTEYLDKEKKRSLGTLETATSPTIDTSLIFHQQPLKVFKGHHFAITDVSWSTGGLLISSSLDSTVRLWHVEHDTCLCTFQHSDCVSSIQFHPFDNGIFVSASLDGRLRLWDIRDKKILYWNNIPKDSITAVSFNRDGSTIIAGTLSGNCVFYDANLKYNTQIAMSQKSTKHKVTGIELMPGTSSSEEKILVTTTDSKIRLINLRDKSLYRTYKGIELKNNRAAASFSQDGDYIIVSTDDRHISIWDTLAQDTNQQYSGMLSAVIHRQFDAARQSGQERFVGSNHSTTWALFAPWKHTEQGTEPFTELSGTVVVVSDDHGHIYVYKTF